ncbi:hypothetical protein ADL19_16810 [Streptomyces purpurogeneiscleroticus]|jgi:hypothetical protein|nr:hypothetical protein ADL19_16810 [Streptomyces purpurogeneiscleroticus]
MNTIKAIVENRSSTSVASDLGWAAGCKTVLRIYRGDFDRVVDCPYDEESADGEAWRDGYAQGTEAAHQLYDRKFS